MPTALWWLKKDFRLADNPALTAALDAGAGVLPVFLFEPAVLRAEETSGFHVAAWIEALEDLRRRLRPHGGDVLALHADAVEAFGRLHEAVPFEAVYSHEEIGSSVTFERDKAVARWCEAAGVAWHQHRQTGVFRGRLDRDRRGKRWRDFMTGGPLPPPDVGDLARIRVPKPARALEPHEGARPTVEAFGHALTAEQRAERQPVSETAAEGTLRSFLTERGLCYSGGISSPNRAF
ncbi:MAG: deoxyribodipyrimidine photo-lyase, partial [Rhodothermales bacterium]|nr:deoxyribodipyrimidine photo-lyase [Rhodothermales bacterium]